MDEPDGLPPEQEPALIHGAASALSRGELVVHPDRAGYIDMVGMLYDDGYRVCVDLTGVDYLMHMERPLPAGVHAERFEVVVNLLSHGRRERLRIRVQVPEADPVVASLFVLHPATEAMEREAFDLMGIRFDAHPDLTRILMPEDWEGHPLRKDYATGRVPVQFKAARASR